MHRGNHTTGGERQTFETESAVPSKPKKKTVTDSSDGVTTDYFRCTAPSAPVVLPAAAAPAAFFPREFPLFFQFSLLLLLLALFVNLLEGSSAIELIHADLC